MRQTGIYPECIAAGVRPHLTSAVKVCQSVPAVAEGCWGNTSALGRSQNRSERRPKRLVWTWTEPSVNLSAFPSVEFRNEDVQVSQLDTRSAKTQLPPCRPASLLRPCRVPRIHLQIKKRHKRRSSFIYKKHVFVFSSSPTWANPRVTLSKPAGKLEDAGCTTSHCFQKNTVFSTLYLWDKCTLNIRCFPQGKFKQEPCQRSWGGCLQNTVTKASSPGRQQMWVIFRNV